MTHPTLLVQRQDPHLLVVQFTDDTEVELTLDQLNTHIGNATYEAETDSFLIRTGDDDSYTVYRLRRNEAVLATDPLQVLTLDELEIDYFTIATLGDDLQVDDTHELLSDLTLRVVRLEQLVEKLTTKGRKKAVVPHTDVGPETSHDELTPEDATGDTEA